ncbi:MAG: 4a-hydroxytetrahydrobiopterin dehydratase [Armatimonadetes bacterium]|nr:4a-hydroxytetrahydrobiopterin dehydratase [Armatimonadota bacterium]
MKKLTDEHIAERLTARENWTLQDGAICRTFEFGDFLGAMHFVNGVAEAAQAADHHPDIDIRYSKVTLRLSTHDANGLTERDFALAATVDALI